MINNDNEDDYDDDDDDDDDGNGEGDDDGDGDDDDQCFYWILKISGHLAIFRQSMIPNLWLHNIYINVKLAWKLIFSDHFAKKNQPMDDDD